LNAERQSEANVLDTQDCLLVLSSPEEVKHEEVQDYRTDHEIRKSTRESVSEGFTEYLQVNAPLWRHLLESFFILRVHL